MTKRLNKALCIYGIILGLTVAAYSLYSMF